MSFYELVFKRNPLSGPILYSLGLKATDLGRFRDAVVADGEIAVYTRNGGPNRDKYFPKEIRQHPNYLRAVDDGFDNTYCTIYFSLPDEWADSLRKWDIAPWDPDKRWQNAIQEMQKPGYKPSTGMEDLIGRLNNAVEEGGSGDVKVLEV